MAKGWTAAEPGKETEKSKFRPLLSRYLTLQTLTIELNSRMGTWFVNIRCKICKDENCTLQELVKIRWIQMVSYGIWIWGLLGLVELFHRIDVVPLTIDRRFVPG